jgi:mRNA interferase MazF
MIRGEVYLAKLDPTVGSEQQGSRPVLVVQADRLNSILPTVVVVPFTSKTKRASLPTCHLVRAGEGGLTVDSVALLHQIRTLDIQRLQRLMGQVSQQTLDAIDKKIAYTLDL